MNPRIDFHSEHHPNIDFNRIAQHALVQYQTFLGEEERRDFKVTKLEDAYWGGDRVVEITLKRQTCDEETILIAHFPPVRSKYAIRAALFMLEKVRQHGIGTPIPLTAPFLNNECIIYVKARGESLENVWPRLTKKQRKAVIRTLATDMLKLFHMQCSQITSFTTCDIDPSLPPFFYSRAFEHTPLLDLELPSSFARTEDYLEALVSRMLWLFDEQKLNNPWLLGYPGKPTLSDQEKSDIHDTWARLKVLIPHYIGGKFLRKSSAPTVNGGHEDALSNQLQIYGIVHTDLKMSRILVEVDESGDLLGPLVYTGWEYVHTAPLWSCARMPRWLTPNCWRTDITPVTEEDRSIMSHVFLGEIRRCQSGGPWMVAFTYGHQERFFEELASCHWKFRDTVEEGIKILRDSWERMLPNEVFPLALKQNDAQSSESSVPVEGAVLLSFPPGPIVFEASGTQNVAAVDEPITTVIPTIPADGDDTSSPALTMGGVSDYLKTLTDSGDPKLTKPHRTLSPPLGASIVSGPLVSPLIGGNAFSKARSYVQRSFSKIVIGRA